MLAVIPFITTTVIDDDDVTWDNVLWKVKRVGKGKVNVGTIVLQVLVGSGQVGQFSSIFAELCLVFSP